MKLQITLLDPEYLHLKQCLVIEDSVMGIRSAKSAGIKTIAITTSNPKEKLYEADIIIDGHEKLFRYLESIKN